MSTLADYIKGKKQERLLSQPVVVRDEWIRQLNDLMARIDEWLNEAKKAGLKVTPGTVEISEEWLGTYEAPMRTIVFEGHVVQVRPRARMYRGGDGRVDIDGDFGLDLLVFSKSDNEWHIVSDYDRLHEGRPLTRESLEQLLKAHL